MKEKPVEDDTLKEDIEGIVMGLQHVDESDRSGLSETIHESLRANRFLGSLCAYEGEYLSCAVEIFAGFGVDEPELNSRTQV